MRSQQPGVPGLYKVPTYLVIYEDVYGMNRNELTIVKKAKMLKDFRHIQATNRELLLRDIEWIQ